MPIYEYQCTDCDNIFEEWCKCSQMEDFMPCPNCAAPSKHIISNTAFILKGSGWYVTEYGNKKNVSDNVEEAKKDESKEKPENNAKESNASDAKLPSETKSSPETKSLSEAKPSADASKVSSPKAKPPETKNRGTTAP